jgi:nitronate monooxygenase
MVMGGRSVATQSDSKSWVKTGFTTRLSIGYPIIQGPLGGLSSQSLTAAVSNFGGLGSFGAHGLKPDEIRKVIIEIRSLTAKPFAINLWVSIEDEGAFTSDESAYHRSLSPLSKHIKEVQGVVPSYTPYDPIRFEEQVKILIEEKVPAFSFIYGIPTKEILDECRHCGIVIIGTATTVDEAIALDEAGVDVIVASGFEAGGHRGSFLLPAEESLIGTIALVPQIVDAVKVPVVAAGGIADVRGIVAAFALGASGVQMGTVFLTCEGSGANPTYRKVLLSDRASTTALTRGFTGRLARGIRNQLLNELSNKNTEILPYPLQRFLLRHLSIPAEKAGQSELLPMWAGQSAGLSHCEDVNELLSNLVKQVSEISGSVQRWSGDYGSHRHS